MISEVHAGGVNSATYATEKETNLVAPESKNTARAPEQISDQTGTPSTIVSLGGATKSEALTYSKQSILANAANTQQTVLVSEAEATKSQPLAAEPEVTTSAFGGTKKPPP